MRPEFLTFPLLLLAAALVATPARAQDEDDEEATPEQQYIYQWTDEEGVIHFVDELSKVPPAHRSGPGLRKIPVGSDEPRPDAGTSTPSPTWGTSTSVRAEERRDEPATEPPPTAQERLRELQEQRDELMLRIAQLEEGSAGEADIERSDEELERLLDQSEKLLERVEREIRKLEGAR